MANITAKEWCETNGVKPDTLRIAFPKIGLSSFAKNRELTPDEIRLIESYPFRMKNRSVSNAKRGKPAVKSEGRPPVSAEVEKKPASPSITSNWEFDSINLIEMGLIGWGLWLLYDISGLFLAAMCCLFIYKTQRLVKQPKMAESSEKALEVIWWLCAASCILHSITFYNSINIHHSGTGDPLLYVHLCAAIIPAVFVSAFSYKAVATTRTITTEQ